MTVLSFVQRLYSLDTLDTRFTTSAGTPLKVATAESAKTTTPNDGKNGNELPPGASPSKYNTWEFYFYALVFLFCVPSMYLAVVDVSQPSHPNYPKYEKLLSPGWLFGRRVDNSDGQYAGFRDNLPYLAVVLLSHPLLRRLYERVSGPATTPVANGTTKEGPSSSHAHARRKQRISFDLAFALLFIIALHGFSALKILLILYINFLLTMNLPRHIIPVATWTFNIGILFANELAHGYRFSVMASAVEPFHGGFADWGKILDGYGGLIPRWEILFNFTVLRSISFNLDYCWSLERDRAGSPIEKKQLDPTALSERDRVSTPAPAHTYTSFTTYLAYTLYSPLYLAGPIITFNDYISQSTYPSPSITPTRTILYGVRFLLTLFCMEFLLHTIYVVAISKADPDWSTYTPFQLAMLAYFNLHIIWQKLLIPWRLFRLWSLIDNIDPPENVVRCMSDNYSALAFWRGWHRSFNRWLVRYIYIPLGGGAGGGTSKVRGVANMLIIFTFVALWHDINLRLLMWGWLITLFVLPEVLGGIAFPKSKWKNRPTAYRMICGVGAVLNILMMMTANLVGFALGLDGLKGLVAGIVGSWSGLAFMATACGALFVGAQTMFEHREAELRKGIKLKC